MWGTPPLGNGARSTVVIGEITSALGKGLSLPTSVAAESDAMPERWHREEIGIREGGFGRMLLPTADLLPNESYGRTRGEPPGT